MSEENGKPRPVDMQSILSPDNLHLTTDITRDVIDGAKDLHSDYIKIMIHSETDFAQWLGWEDYVLMLICRGMAGIDCENMTFNEIVNTALINGGLITARFQSEMRKELGITT